MTPEQKIAQVLKQIRDEAAINPDPRLMKFNLNNYIVGAGILTDDEERRILLKLKKEGVIDLRLSQYKNTEPKEIVVVSSDEARMFLESVYYWVEILEGFEEKYKAYSPYLEAAKVKVKKANHDKSYVDSKDTKNLVNVSGDYVAGDKIGRDKNTNLPESNWLSKYWWQLLIAVVSGVIVFLITQGKISTLFNLPITQVSPTRSSLATSTVHVWDILSKNESFNTSLERQTFFDSFKGAITDGAGSFIDISKTSDTYYVFMQIGKYPVACSFTNVDAQVERNLMLLKKGDKISFSGTFANSSLNNVAWYITNCTLL